MRLSAEQRRMLDGERGWPRQIAMRMLAAVGRALDAPDLIPASSAHLVIDGTALGAAGRDFLERLVREGGRFAIPASINAIAVDRRRSDGSGAAADQLRMLEACEKMGAMPSCSCNPFIQGIRPARGETVAWSESATAPYVNSVLGARTNREGATALASALTGLTPRCGMHVAANRVGDMLFRVRTDVAGVDGYSLLGALVGRAAGARPPVIDGIAAAPTEDEFVAFSAAFAIHGEAAMFHMAGITPEAPTLAEAFGGRPPPEPVIVDADALEDARRRVGPGADGPVDVVSIGCPHASLAQLREVADRAAGGRADGGVAFYVHTNLSTWDAADADGTVDRLRRAGIVVTTDNCAVVSYERLPAGTRLATNSTKMALFAKSVADAEILYGSAEQCIAAGLTGRWTSGAG